MWHNYKDHKNLENFDEYDKNQYENTHLISKPNKKIILGDSRNYRILRILFRSYDIKKQNSIM